MRCNRDISLEFESFIASLQTNRQNNILKIGVSLQFDNEQSYIVQYIVYQCFAFKCVDSIHNYVRYHKENI